jgi:hypothetical protein
MRFGRTLWQETEAGSMRHNLSLVADEGRETSKPGPFAFLNEPQVTKRDTTLTGAGTSSPSASTQIRPTTAPTCADGSDGSESEYASPAKASNPAND